MSHRAPSCLRVALRFAVFSLFTVAVLLGTSLLCAIALGLFDGRAIIGPWNLSAGLVCTLIVWLFVAVFHLRKETVTLPAPDRERFLQNSRLLLTEMGYEVTSRGPLRLSTRPHFHSLLFGGGVQVAVTGTHAHLIGPKVCVELLRNRLRIQAHLDSAQQSLREYRFTETFIKCAELRMRVNPEDFASVRTNVIEVLQASAEVVCEIHLLAQSEVGIRESILEFQINQWLAEQGIESTLHKHFIQLHRPLTNAEIALDNVV